MLLSKTFVTAAMGRSLVANMRMAIKMLEMKPDKIYLSARFAKAEPECPYLDARKMAKILEHNTGIPVSSGTHDYH
jgi:predicted metal-binding protein